MYQGFPARSLGQVLAGEDGAQPAPVVDPYALWLPGPLGSHWPLLCPDTNKINVFYAMTVACESSTISDIQGAKVKIVV